jgi:peptidylprolyl isomerase
MKKAPLIAAALSLSLAAVSLPLHGQEKATDKSAAKPAEKPAPEKKESKMTKTPSGLQYEDVVVGAGAEPKAGQTCSVHYTGWLWINGAKGTKFDSSVDRGQPFQFSVGRGQVIRGWDEGVLTMKVGGKRNLIIPAGLGYGAQGAGGVIPPHATLFFEVELLGAK